MSNNDKLIDRINSRKANLNKPSEDNESIFQHTTNEEVTMDYIEVNGLIDMFAQKYTEKWSSALNLKHRQFKLDDIKDIIANNQLSVDDMKEYINWLFNGRLNNKFKGNLGCLHSQPMISEWKEIKGVSNSTADEEFKKLRDAMGMSEDTRLYNDYATPAEKATWDKYFDLDYIGEGSMDVNKKIMDACRQRSKGVIIPSVY